MYYKLDKDVVFFIGSSQETSPVQGKKTLYVNGLRSIPQTLELAAANNCKHIHLGAQRSFQKNKLWDGYIRALMNAGYTVTLEYPAEAQDFVQSSISSELLMSKKFYPVLTVPINYVNNINPNASIKITDTYPANEGVWTIPMHEVLDANRYTDHSEMDFDVIVVDTSKTKDAK